jgi:hypothetical protein
VLLVYAYTRLIYKVSLLRNIKEDQLDCASNAGLHVASNLGKGYGWSSDERFGSRQRCCSRHILKLRCFSGQAVCAMHKEVKDCCHNPPRLLLGSFPSH